MRKKISAVIGEYKKDGQTKAEWADVGVILTNNNGKDYMLLNTEISLSGIMAKQNALAMSKNEPIRANVMCSIIEDNDQQNNNQGQNNQNPGYQQNNQQQQMQNQNNQSQQGQQQQAPNYQGQNNDGGFRQG